MKKLFIINTLAFSTLAVSAQNISNNAFGNGNVAQQQSINYIDNNANDVQVASNNNRGNGSRSSAFQNFNENKDINVQTANLPVKQKTANKAPVRGNVFVNDNNLGNQGPPINNDINDVNINTNVNPQINSNPQINTNKPVNKAPIAIEESHDSDFKQIGLSGRDYSNGGKLKKGQKNFYKQEVTKVKHKKKPGFKKAKYHTSKCAKW